MILMNQKVKGKPQAPQEEMPVLALRGLVLFPHMVLHFDVGREKSIMALNEAMTKSRKVFLVAQRDVRDNDPTSGQLYQVGVVAEIRQIVRTQGDTLRVLVDGIQRGRLVEIVSDSPYLSGMVEDYPISNRISNRALCDALTRTLKEIFEEYSYLSPKMPRDLVANVVGSGDPFHLVEYIAGNIPLRYEDKQRVLEESTIIRRLETLIKLLENENEILSLEQDIHERVKEQIDKNQREYYLREQMKAISNELGEGENLFEELEEYQDKILSLHLPEESEEKLLKEMERLEKMPSNSHEAAVIRGYLDTVLDLPWNRYTKDKIDLVKAQKLLDKEHYGLKKVKERILEMLAVRKLSPDIKGQIICLIGPPGVGKTSIARSIAQSMGRKYARMSLGGVRDESDIRGHRKTYIGSMPGRIISALRQAGSANALILLDEIDKLGNDFRGDPASALLEVLDAEQNHAFRDHFIEIPFDLSKVLFIATANSRDTIPGPLYDRMEVIDLSSYTREEKMNIAKRHLVPKQMKVHGLTSKNLRIADSALYGMIDFYTREAGVRTLERKIAALCRKAAMETVSAQEPVKVSVTGETLEKFLGPHKFRNDEMEKQDQVGVANGLAWTAVGGEMLQVEAAVMDGSGKHQSTGSLGEVMKESVSAAITYIRGVASRYGISESFYKDKDIHIHFPEGAVPKDGPSAGITTCTALISALSGIPIRHNVAMTGEITLRGRVLAIGGLREKTMAAYKNGMDTVIIPKANVADLAELDETIRKSILFVPADNIETVLSHALAYLPEAQEEKTMVARIPAPEDRGGVPLRQ